MERDEPHVERSSNDDFFTLLFQRPQQEVVELIKKSAALRKLKRFINSLFSSKTHGDPYEQYDQESYHSKQNQTLPCDGVDANVEWSCMNSYQRN